MYKFGVHEHINNLLKQHQIDLDGKDHFFYSRFLANTDTIFDLYLQLYEQHSEAETLFHHVTETITNAYVKRAEPLKKRDEEKMAKNHWFLSNHINGMSLYVDRFCGNLQTLQTKLAYFEELGVNFLHLMPVFESPPNESDGGYAVSNFRKVDERFGTLADLEVLQHAMQKKEMYLMLDIVLNHTSHEHEWAQKAKQGDKIYQDYFYFFNDRSLPDEYDKSMPEIFPESSPGNFTYIPECNKWVMTVFHDYQWDLNYTNPRVFIEMLDTIFFYANIGVDVLRIDAPAFIWKQLGTTCQNLPKAHTVLKLIKQCVQVAAPGMALLGEAIVAPKEIMKYFGTDKFTARECDMAYNATHMALQWDMLATGDTKVMLAAQHDILQKPLGTTWITYTRCHDDIGLGYDDEMITRSGYNSYAHRKFIKDYYSGFYNGSPAKGALFSSNPKTGDARISGSLASLCGLETAVNNNKPEAITLSIQKIIMMQAHSFFLGGVPMLFYGDEMGYTNDYSYLQDEGKSYDNRWMHRPVIDWKKNKLRQQEGTIEHRVFNATKKLLSLRKTFTVFADYNNLTWLTPHNTHIAAFQRQQKNQRLFCVFNFSHEVALLTWYTFKEKGNAPAELYDHWSKQTFKVGNDHEYLTVQPYGFYLLEG